MNNVNDRGAHAPEHIPAKLFAALSASLVDRREALNHRLDLLAHELPSDSVDGLRGLGDAEVVRAQYETTRAQLLEVDAAIDRIDAGGYGCCVECAAPINVDRLEAIPHAGLCLTCTAST